MKKYKVITTTDEGEVLHTEIIGVYTEAEVDDGTLGREMDSTNFDTFISPLEGNPHDFEDMAEEIYYAIMNHYYKEK